VSCNFLRENDDGGIYFTRSTGSIARNLVVRTQGSCCSSGTAIDIYGCDGSVLVDGNTLYKDGYSYDEYGGVSAAEIAYRHPSVEVSRNVIVGKSQYPWVVCDRSTGGCTAAALMDILPAGDPSNLVYGTGLGLPETLGSSCLETPQHDDPKFCDEATDNFFPRPGSPCVVDTTIGNLPPIVHRWGALPIGCGPSDALDVAAPPDALPAGATPGDVYALDGFTITNTSPFEATVNYRLFATGGTLSDNGDPLSLVGTSPVLAPGETFVPSPAGIVIPDGEATVEVKYGYAFAPALNIVDTVRTTIHFGNPVAVRVASFRARVEDAGVRLQWSTGAGVGDVRWTIRRAAGGSTFESITSTPLFAATREFFDTSAHAGVSYQYRLIALDPDESIAAELEVTLNASLTLAQNIPNPFNPETTIGFSIPSSSRVVLAIYRVDGSRVRTLLERTMPGGVYRETWDGRDARGNPSPSGVYFCRLTAGSKSLTRKMVLAR
jgi:FlgD Ig-like domain